MRILIVEDESLAARRLEKMINELQPTWQVVGKTTSIAETVSFLQNTTFDLIFLDIQLSDGLSFDVFQQVEVNTPVIFTTAYDEYALKAFDINSLAYLLKPIRKDRLAEALEKYQKIQQVWSGDMSWLIKQVQGQSPVFRERFLVQVGERFVKIETGDIAYFYAMAKHVFVKTFSNRTYPVDYSLDALEKMLDPGRFFRINRKLMLQVEAIDQMHAYSRGRVKISLQPPPDEDIEAIVSGERSGAFKSWMNR